MDEIEEMCAFLTELGVDGMLLSPGYHYEAITEDHFLHREETHQKFQRVLELSKRYPISSTPLFLEFAAGQRDYPCTPWGNPTRTPKGWKGPCYLIEGKYYPTLEGLLGRRRLGLLGVAPGPALPELPHALGLRAVGGAQARARARATCWTLDDAQVEPAGQRRASQGPSASRRAGRAVSRRQRASRGSVSICWAAGRPSAQALDEQSLVGEGVRGYAERDPRRTPTSVMSTSSRASTWTLAVCAGLEPGPGRRQDPPGSRSTCWRTRRTSPCRRRCARPGH